MNSYFNQIYLKNFNNPSSKSEEYQAFLDSNHMGPIHSCLYTRIIERLFIK